MRIVSFVAVCALLAAAAAPGRADPIWQPYVSPEGRSAVLLPGVPPKTDSTLITLWDRVTKAVLFDFSDSVGNDRVNYTVMYGDVPSNVFANFFNGSTESLLAHARDSALRQGRTLISDAPVWLNGIPGRVLGPRRRRKPLRRALLFREQSVLSTHRRGHTGVFGDGRRCVHGVVPNQLAG